MFRRTDHRDPIADYIEWTNNRYNPGYYLGGNVSPFLRASRLSPRSRRLMSGGLALSALLAVASVLSSLTMGPDIARLTLLYGTTVAVLIAAAAVVMFRRGRHEPAPSPVPMATVRREVSDRLIALGFHHHGRAHLKRIDSDFSWCVDTGPIGSRTDIAPFVGIRSDAVEHARSELMALPDDAWIGTVGGNVGDVLGGPYKFWEGGAHAKDIVETMTAGLEALRPYTTLTSLAGVFEHDWAARHPGAPYTRVTVALLTGDRARVLAELTSAESTLCAHADEVCEQFREFDARVRRRLE
jgi:hypothetical protein